MAASRLDLSLERPMPQSPDAERAVLGSILINNHAFYRVIGSVKKEDFFRDAHRVIFGAMQALAERSEEIDLITLKNLLAQRQELGMAGGPSYISSLLEAVPDIANVERYAAIVKEKSMLRRLAIMGSKVLSEALDAPTPESRDVLSSAEKQLYDIAEGVTERGFVHLEKITRANLLAIEATHASGRLVTGVPTGYDRFNEMTSGFQPADLIILAARPSMGKTALLLNIAQALSLPGHDGRPRCGERLYVSGIFSLEMSKEQIGLRLLSAESGVPSHMIRSGMLSEANWLALADASTRLSKGMIYVDDTPALQLLDMRAKARRLKMEIGVDLLMVDYLQLMTAGGRVESRQQEVSQISRGLKAVAKEMNLPVLSLSQLSRRPEQRVGDHRPQLSDLRESGSIEQDADLVLFIYRDEVYNRDTEDRGIAEIIVAKQRNGPIGDFKLVYRNDITRFYNFEPEQRGYVQ